MSTLIAASPRFAYELPARWSGPRVIRQTKSKLGGSVSHRMQTGPSSLVTSKPGMSPRARLILGSLRSTPATVWPSSWLR
jgi:hypothetical protein